MRYFHTIPPVFDESSSILILGSFPSVKSREGMFFYHHPQNRFWRVLSILLGTPLPLTIDEKRNMLLQNRIALWDVIESCDIVGSQDSSISAAAPNNLLLITNNSNIKHIFTNGGTAFSLYNRYGRAMTGIKAVKLPSTSPANAKFDLESLVFKWGVISDLLGKR